MLIIYIQKLLENDTWVPVLDMVKSDWVTKQFYYCGAAS